MMCGGIEDAWEEVEVFVLMFKDVVIELRSDDASGVFF